MRIPDGYSKRVASTTRVRSRTASTPIVGPTGVVVAPTDSLEVSARAGEVARARTLALQAPEIREPLVNEISVQIDRGEYHVSGGHVAPLLVQDHLQFAGAASPPL